MALILAAVIAIALGSYLRLSQTALRLAHGTLHQQAALNLAETGLEEAVWTLNHGDWTGWTQPAPESPDRRRTFTFDPPGQGQTATVTVYVANATRRRPPLPVAYARTVLTTGHGQPVEKWLKVDLIKRSPFGNGLLARETVHFGGPYATVDSYDSRLGNFNELLRGGSRNRSARGPIAGQRVVADGAIASSRDIFGYVSVGMGATGPGLWMPAKGIVSGDFQAEPGTVEASRVLPTFVSALKDRDTPANTGFAIGSITNSLALPRPGDKPDAAGVYYYDVEAIHLTGFFQHLTIRSNVVIRILAPFREAVTITGGNSGIIVAPYARLQMYVPTDVTIVGGGVANNNAPGHFVLWGTSSKANVVPQRITLTGNGHLNAAVYAPNAEVIISGGGPAGGTVRGAMVGRTILFNADDFHYDEALTAFDYGEPFGPGLWQELVTPEERAAHAVKLQ